MEYAKKSVYDAKQDTEFRNPVIDVREKRVRNLLSGEQVPYLYLHGKFEGTNVKFSYCFPEEERFEGRFFQHLSPFPGPDEELAALDKTGEEDAIGFALSHGACYVESNMGSREIFGGEEDATIFYRSSAAVAEYCRTVAKELYGTARVYGYVYGGSGGGYKTMSCIENTSAWDGAVPFVIGSPMSLPNCLTVAALGKRMLRNCWEKVVDALEPGGSGNPYDGLNEEEQEALRELTQMGFPPRMCVTFASDDDGSLPVLTPGVHAMDPDYFTDFWTKAGYEGTVESGSAQRDRVCVRAKVVSVGSLDEVKAAGIKEPTNGVSAADTLSAADSFRVEGGLGIKDGLGATENLSVEPSLNETGEPGCADDCHSTDGRNGTDDAWQKMMTDASSFYIQVEGLSLGKNPYLKGVDITFESGAAKGKKLRLDRILEALPEGCPRREASHTPCGISAERNALEGAEQSAAERNALKGAEQSADAQNEGGFSSREGSEKCFLIPGTFYGMDDFREVLQAVKPGDEISLDNSDYIAIQYYHRHQVPEDLSFHAWDQYRDDDGKPICPQQKKVIAFEFTTGGCGSVQDGQIQGKVIVINNLMDGDFPWQADWYRKKVEEVYGEEAGNRFRVWYNDNCPHGDVSEGGDPLRVVSYLGQLNQALLDVAAWAEKGIAPVPNTGYEMIDNQVILAEDAKARGGIQPLVRLLARTGQTGASDETGLLCEKQNGMDGSSCGQAKRGDVLTRTEPTCGDVCVKVKAGELVVFEALVEMPEAAGEFAQAEFSFEGEPDYSHPAQQVTTWEEDGIRKARVTASHRYEKPGTYFGVVRVASARDSADAYTYLRNLCRVRVIVE